MTGGGTEREGETESKAVSRLWDVSTEPDAGIDLTNVRSWPEPKSDTNHLSHPVATTFLFLKETYKSKTFINSDRFIHHQTGCLDLLTYALKKKFVLVNNSTCAKPIKSHLNRYSAIMQVDKFEFICHNGIFKKIYWSGVSKIPNYCVTVLIFWNHIGMDKKKIAYKKSL